MNESSKGDEFDSLRKMRNGINYYGKKLSPEKSENLIKKTKNLRGFVLRLLSEAK